MKSIRTQLSKYDTANFRLFLDNIGLQEVILGIYEDIVDHCYRRESICYAYSEKSDEVVAILTYISLKYGSLYDAFRNYMNALSNTSMNDPYFNWTP